ncbi:uncharacterized protein PAC_10100 [Phialocephala subalpina]|uniref:N-acetyltransferase domain-containing protein n=1 Tax=Phialocephala subalpina TaxID=576137 RepID=A0A1L7X5A5_9HELO|nr:uncharacterized protein PAC_10100 [Phialocephala subalpina]
MPLELQEVDLSDSPALANVQISAFFNDPFQKSLYPGMSFESQLVGLIARWPANYHDFVGHWKKVIDTETGEVVSWSKWAFEFTDAGAELQGPTGFPKDFKLEPLTSPKGLNEQLSTEIARKFRESRERHLGERPQLQLKLMVTLPSCQRRGAASLQLFWATEFADRHGLVCWTEASVVAVPVYKKFGFEAVDEIITEFDESVGGGEYVSNCMIREPKRTSR